MDKKNSNNNNKDIQNKGAKINKCFFTDSENESVLKCVKYVVGKESCMRDRSKILLNKSNIQLIAPTLDMKIKPSIEAAKILKKILGIAIKDGFNNESFSINDDIKSSYKKISDLVLK